MNFRKLGLACVVCVFFSNIYAAGPSKGIQFYNSEKEDWSFVENKGQLSGENGTLNDAVKYYSHAGGATIFCMPGMVRFTFLKIDNEPGFSEATGKLSNGLKGGKDHVTTSTIDLILKNANARAVISATDMQPYFENYYSSGKQVTEAHTYKTITYKNIYPDIDMVVRARPRGMKYEFVVYPGGRVKDIQLLWNGTNKIALAQDGGMQFAGRLASIRDSKPVSFQKGNAVSTIFILKNNVVRFGINHFDHSKPLIIDPFLEWSTYFGGKDVEQATCIATDNSNNIYITGSTRSIAGIADINAFQPNQGGTFDAFVTKFSSLGVKQWSSYFGGTERDIANGIAVDKAGNIFIAGTTSSTTGIASPGAYQESYIPGTQNNNTNAFVAKFSSNGKRTWSTYFGKGMDNASAISMDDLGDIFITGTTSTLNKGQNDASVQNTNGTSDAYIAKFSNSGSLVWAIPFGGPANENGNGIANDHQGNIYITGQTYSGIHIATPGAYQENHPDADQAEDGFIAKFSANGNLVWGSYFGGNKGARPTGITVDDAGNPYITGYTESTSGIATPGAYQTQYGYAGDAFVAAFTPAGNCNWATYLGGDGDDKSNAIKTDHQGNIYITGNTGSAAAIATTNAWQINMGGGCNDAFTAVFAPTGNLSWATYYGNRGGEVGYGLALDNTGNVYITGVTNSASGMSTPGASQMLDAGKADVFIVKYSQKAIFTNGITLDHTTLANNFKGPQTIKTNVTNHSNVIQDNVKIGWSINGKTQAPYIWTGRLMPDNTVTVTLGKVIFETGKDTIKTWVYSTNDKLLQDADSYVIADTSLAPANAHFTIKQLSSLNHAFMAADTTLTLYKWDFGDPVGHHAFLNYKPVHSFATEDAYHVSLTVNNKNGYSYTFDTLINARMLDIDNNGTGNFKLSVFPNPFQSATSVAYSLGKLTNVKITMFDISGREIGILSSQAQNAGFYQVDVNAEKYKLQPGIYLLKCVFDGVVVTRHIVYGGY
jgi:hypothetical protein